MNLYLTSSQGMFLCTPPPKQSCSHCLHILPTRKLCSPPLPRSHPIAQSPHWKQYFHVTKINFILCWPARASVERKMTNFVFWFFHRLILFTTWQALCLGYVLAIWSHSIPFLILITLVAKLLSLPPHPPQVNCWHEEVSGELNHLRINIMITQVKDTISFTP